MAGWSNTSFVQAEYVSKNKQTWREKFLAEMEQQAPWTRLVRAPSRSISRIAQAECRHTWRRCCVNGGVAVLGSLALGWNLASNIMPLQPRQTVPPCLSLSSGNIRDATTALKAPLKMASSPPSRRCRLRARTCSRRKQHDHSLITTQDS
jgi:hypothetical protein